MSRRMYRYVVPADDKVHTHSLTTDPVAVAVRPDFAVEFWAEDDDSKPARERHFQVYGTGHKLPEGATWVGTAPRTPEGLVLHLYEVTP